MKVGGEVARCGEDALSVLAFAFAVELFPPLTHVVQLGLVVHHYLYLLACLLVQCVAHGCVYGCRVVLVGSLRGTSLLHVSSSGYQLRDVESGACYREQAHGCEYREASAHIVGYDECLVSLFVGSCACGTLVSVGNGHDYLFGLFFAALVFTLFLEQAESESCLSGGSRFRYVDYSEFLSFEIFGEFCEGNYIQPTFITDYPVEMSPLTKRHRNNPDLTERFELMVNGKELCNAYSELNDPIDQAERFKEQLRLSEKGDDEAMFIDQDFVRALEYGMPPTSGMGIGMDRLVMLMTGQSTIQEVLLFPQMRPEKVEKRDKAEAYTAIGVPAEWVEVVQKAGCLTVEALAGAGAGKLHQDLCGFNKKYKLGLANPTIDDVKSWIENAATK